MPFKSEKQRKYMHANHPEIAARWERKYGPAPKIKRTNMAKTVRKPKPRKPRPRPY